MTDHDDRDDLDGDEFLDPAIEAAFGAKQIKEIPGSRSVVEVASGEHGAPRVLLRDVIDEVDNTARVRRAREESNGYPDQIDRYHVVGEIARGGVGIILRARDADLGREVAIKVLRNEHRGNGYLIRRFLEEAQIGGQLQHPGIVPVHEIGLYEIDRPYLAMKYVKGRTLGELLESRKDENEDPQRFLAVFEQVCQTLAYAHARGVIHRDLKPSNVMVGPFGEVQVMDWGLAKVLEKGGVADDKRSTKLVAPESLLVSAQPRSPGADSVAGSVVGTPAYMAPEQARGDLVSLDEHTDVFGLGAILCEILTGLPPYVGKTSAEVMNKARSADLGDAYDRLEHCCADRALTDLARACLSSEQRERPRNAIVVSKRIQSHLESLRARARNLEIRAAKTRFRLTLAVLVIFGMALGGSGFLVFERDRHERNDRALTAVEGASFQAERLKAEARVTRDLSTWNAALREASRAVDFAVDVEEPVRQRAVDLRETLKREVTDQLVLAELELLEQDRGENSDELFEAFLGVLSGLGIDIESTAPEEAGRIVRESAIRSSLIVALDRWLLAPLGAMNDRLYQITQEADSDGWRKRVRAAIKEQDLVEISRLANDAETRTLEPSTYELLASALRPRKRRWRGASQNAEHTKQAERLWRLAQQAHPDDFWINVHLGRFLRDQERNDEAEPFVRVAVALRPRSAYARYELGSTLREKGQIVDAVEELRESIALDPDLSFAKAYGKLSDILSNEEERAALPRNELRAVVDRLSNVLDSVHRHHAASVVRVIAQAHKALGETGEAILVIESGRRRGVSLGKRHRSGQTLEDLLAEYRREIAPKVVSYASIDALLESSGPGAEEALQSLRQDETETEKSNPLLLYWKSRELELQGNTEEAVSGYREALELDRSLPETALRLATCLRSLGQLQEAEHILREALHSEPGQIPEIWEQWIEMSLGELGRTAQQTLDALPKSPPSAYRADLHWLFERLASGTPVLINCGGDEYSGADGSHWGKDRFFSTTLFSFSGAKFFGEISQTSDDTLYQSDRVFFPTKGDPSRRMEGYRIPLPRGRYAVELHFAEIYPPAGERREFIRRFDVFVENETVREDYEPARRGLGVAEAFNIEVVVADGFLDIEFGARSREPKIAAIAVRPAR